MAFPGPFCCRIPSGDGILAYTFVGFWLAVGRATGFFVIFVVRNFGEVNSKRFTMTGFCRIVSRFFPTGCCPHFNFCNLKGGSFSSFTPRKFNIAPKTWWSKEDPLLLGLPIFRGELFRAWLWWCLKRCRILAIRKKILRIWVFLSGYKFKGVLYVLGTSFALEGKVSTVFHPSCLRSARTSLEHVGQLASAATAYCVHDGDIDQSIGTMYALLVAYIAILAPKFLLMSAGAALAFLTAPVACGGANIPLFDAMGAPGATKKSVGAVLALSIKATLADQFSTSQLTQKLSIPKGFFGSFPSSGGGGLGVTKFLTVSTSLLGSKTLIDIHPHMAGHPKSQKLKIWVVRIVMRKWERN